MWDWIRSLPWLLQWILFAFAVPIGLWLLGILILFMDPSSVGNDSERAGKYGCLTYPLFLGTWGGGLLSVIGGVTYLLWSRYGVPYELGVIPAIILTFGGLLGGLTLRDRLR